MKTFDEYREALGTIESTVEYRVEVAALRFVGEVVGAMRLGGVKQASLATRLGTSEAYVSKALRGDTNFTLATMVRIADALGRELHLHLAERGATVRWLDLVKGGLSSPKGALLPPEVTFSHIQPAGESDATGTIAA